MTTDRVRRGAFVALLVVLALLVASGVYLTFEYRPNDTASYWDSETGQWAHRVRVVHRLLASPAIVLGVLVAGLGFTSGHRRAVGIPVLLVAAAIGGYALPWDQLALWAVTVGTDLSGVLKPAFDDHIRFVVIDGSEVGQDSYRLAVLLHLVALPVLLGAFLFASRRVGRAGDTHDPARRSHGGRRHDVGAGPP